MNLTLTTKEIELGNLLATIVIAGMRAPANQDRGSYSTISREISYLLQSLFGGEVEIRANAVAHIVCRRLELPEQLVLKNQHQLGIAAEGCAFVAEALAIDEGAQGRFALRRRKLASLLRAYKNGSWCF